MKKVIRLSESDLNRLVKRIIKESDMMDEMMDVSSDSEYYQGRKREVTIPFDELSMLGQFATEFCRGKEGLPDCKKVREIYRNYNLFM
jgi:hypothetical protein